jgi:hypothetical protein
MHFPIYHTKDIFARHMKFNFLPGVLILLMMIMLQPVMGQQLLTDSSGAKPKLLKPMDSLFQVNLKPSVYGGYTGGVMAGDTIFRSAAESPRIPVLLRKVENRDWIFYFFCSVLLLLAFIHLSFEKYFNDLFRVFFNTSLRQKQIREQLTQSPLPSLLLNLLFFLSGGIFIYFLLEYYDFHSKYPAPLEIFFCLAGLGAIYLVKYIFISMLGWVFDKKMASENYLFNVFMVNKIAGLLLLPMGILLAYSSEKWSGIVLTLTVTCLILLVFVRLARGYSSVSNVLKINQLHFIVFVTAFEVIPLLLIYRVLLRVIE